MSYFGQGWGSRREQQPRWQEGGDGAEQDDEDEGYGGMDRGTAARAGAAAKCRCKEAATNLRSQAAGEAAAGSRSGSSGSKNGDVHGTRDGILEEEVSDHEAKRCRWGIVRDGSRADARTAADAATAFMT